GSGRIRMEVLGDLSADALCGFVSDNVVPGATVHTDAWQGYRRLAKLGYDHQLKSLRAGRFLGEDVGEIVPRAHRVISNLKAWLQGTYHGVSGDPLQFNLADSSFRFSRRPPLRAASQPSLGLETPRAPTPCNHT